MSNRKLIYLDDKEANLLAFKALLRREFDVFTSTSAIDALDMIAAQDIAVVIADYKMPQMTGVQFLEQVRIRYPQTVRVLLSGHADINAVIESVNKGEVFRFIKKPWIESLLINEIKNAFELYDAKSSLQLKNKELELAYTELSHFTYSAAHNLTGPVATIQGLVDLIRHEPDNQVEYLNYLEHTVHVLNNHLRNVISFNQNKSIDVKPEAIDIKKLLVGIDRDFRSYPGFSDLRLTVSSNGHKTFISDRMRLNLIMSNLLINAIKYSDDAKPEKLVEISCDVNAHETRISVWDNGIGVLPENLARLTEIFFRESTGRLGSGIGLFVVKEALEKLQGEIEFDSKKGEYTRVTLVLPLMNGNK